MQGLRLPEAKVSEIYYHYLGSEGFVLVFEFQNLKIKEIWVP